MIVRGTDAEYNTTIKEAIHGGGSGRVYKRPSFKNILC
jgi:hypothetical protein